MKEFKFWTLNCSLLNDKEFEELTDDIEKYIDTRGGDWALPQQDSERWLNQFIGSYKDWSERQFRANQHPLRSYFKIDTRLIQADHPHYKRV